MRVDLLCWRSKYAFPFYRQAIFWWSNIESLISLHTWGSRYILWKTGSDVNDGGWAAGIGSTHSLTCVTCGRLVLWVSYAILWLIYTYETSRWKKKENKVVVECYYRRHIDSWGLCLVTKACVHSTQSHRMFMLTKLILGFLLCWIAENSNYS